MQERMESGSGPSPNGMRSPHGGFVTETFIHSSEVSGECGATRSHPGQLRARAPTSSASTFGDRSRKPHAALLSPWQLSHAHAAPKTFARRESSVGVHRIAARSGSKPLAGASCVPVTCESGSRSRCARAPCSSHAIVIAHARSNKSEQGRASPCRGRARDVRASAGGDLTANRK